MSSKLLQQLDDIVKFLTSKLTSDNCLDPLTLIRRGSGSSLGTKAEEDNSDLGGIIV